MTAPEQVQLLPCPFCGDRMEWSGDFVRHLDDKSACPIRQDGFVNVHLWNTRHTATAEQVQITQADRDAKCRIQQRILTEGISKSQDIDEGLAAHRHTATADALEAMREAVAKHGRHRPVCRMYVNAYEDCTCGLTDSLRRLTAAIAKIEGDTK